MAEAAAAGCPNCISIKDSQLPGKVVIISSNDLLEDPRQTVKKQRKKIRKEKQEEFLKYVNALINNGGGYICLHVQSAYLLGTFEQSVNGAMAALIPDDSSFHENFERHILGEHHVTFRVKPKARPLSTLDFNTKIPLDRGVEDPTHGQMRYLMQRNQDNDETTEDYEQRKFIYREGGEIEFEEKVCVKLPIPEKPVFQESRSIQAKRVKKTENNFSSLLDEKFFNKDVFSTYLPKYISAFSKLEHGGSIFLGIKEDKTETPKWQEVEEVEKNNLLTLHDADVGIWKDNNGVYMVATDRPPENEEKQSGKFICEGVKLRPEERDTLREKIKQLIRDNMYWQPTDDKQQAKDFQVDVWFHDVEVTDSSVELFVVEIEVHQYKGMAFYNERGPFAYKILPQNEDDNIQLSTVKTGDWFKMMKKPFGGS